MPTIQLLIDRTSQEHQRLAEALQRQLMGTELLKVTTVQQSAPGTLSIETDVLQFVVEHHEELLKWVPAVVQAISVIVGLVAKKQSKPVVVVAGAGVGGARGGRGTG